MSAITSPFSAVGQIALPTRPYDKSMLVNLYGTQTGLVFNFEGSVDGVNGWAAIDVTDRVTGRTVIGTAISPSDAASYIWEIPCDGLKVRMNVTGITGGVGNIVQTNSEDPPVASGSGTPQINVAVASLAAAITSNGANAFTVGANGTTNPAFNVDASTASIATGLDVKGAAAAGGLALKVLSSGTNESMTINAKGTGTISFQTVATGNIILGDAINLQLNTTTGTKIGTATTQKLAFWNATPIVQPANTVDYVTMFVNLGLRASGGTASASFPGAITSSAPTGGGIGYATGAGGAVTQATDRTTGVTLSKLAGQITTHNASLAAEAAAEFTVTNTTVAIGDVVVVSIQSGTNGGNTAVAVTTVAAGSFKIKVSNNNAAGGTAETGAIIINYAVIKSVAA